MCRDRSGFSVIPTVGTLNHQVLMGRNGETPIFDAITPPKINIDTKMAIFFKGATFSSQPIILAIQPLVFGGVFGVIQHETTIFQVDVWGRDVK